MMNFRRFLGLLSIFLLCSTTIHTKPKTTTHYLFAHGLGATERQAAHYKAQDIILEPYHTFNFPDAENGKINFKESSLAQDNEIARLKKVYDQVCAHTRSCKSHIVLTGMSRGASTIISFMGKYNPKKIKALVLESPFDCIESVLHQKLRYFWLTWLPFGLEIAHWVAETTYGQYQRDGVRPIDQITKIKNKNLPILFICSKQDILIPWESTYSLYQTCKKAGFTRVHVVVIDHGVHGYLLKGNSCTEYKQAVHAFYKKYNLPHDSILAKQGNTWLI